MYRFVKPEPLEIVLVRHGAIEGAVQGSFYGYTDYELSQLGREQVACAGGRLAGESFDEAYVSTLSRAKETMGILRECAKIDVVPIEDARLCEMNFGSVEGYTYTQILNEYPELASGINGDWLHCAFPEGESPISFSMRVKSFFTELIEKRKSGKILVVAHGGTVRAALCALLELGDDFFWRFKCDFASVTRVSILDGYAVLHTLNN